MTISQIISLVRLKLLEQTTEVVSDETLLVYANLVDIDLVKRIFTNNKIKTSTIALTNGVGNLPIDFGTLYGYGKDIADNNYEELSIEDFDNKSLDRMMTVMDNKLHVYPTTISNITIKYYPTFSSLTAGSTPSVDEYFHECMVYGILERAFEDLQDESLSAFYKSKYENEILTRSARQSNYEEGNQRGSQMFSFQQLI